jgi:DNA polymerase epsilon subunit 1
MTRDSVWDCDCCGTPYDRVSIEHRLIGIVNSRMVKWHLQDLQCVRCRNVSMYSLRRRCTCSGELVLEVSREDMERKMGVMRGVAAFYGLGMLGEVISGVFGESK